MSIGTRIRIHFFQILIRGSGSTITEMWIRGSGSTIPKCGSPDPDPHQNEMDSQRCDTLKNICPEDTDMRSHAADWDLQVRIQGR